MQTQQSVATGCPPEATHIKLSELRAALSRALLRLQDDHGDELELTDDLYWCVSADARYDPTQAPTALVEYVGRRLGG